MFRSTLQLYPHTPSAKEAFELRSFKENKQEEAQAVSAAVILT